MSVAGRLAWHESVGILIRCFVEGFRALGAPRLWWPLLPWLALEILAAFWLSSFPEPPRDRLVPLWEWVGGSGATHFPRSGAVLPRVLAWIAPALEWSAGVAGLAVVCRALPDRFRGATGAGPTAPRPRVATCLAATAPVLALGATFGILSDLTFRLPTPGPAVGTLAIVGAVAVRSLGAYVIASVVLGRRSALGALRRSAAFAAHHFLATATIVGVGFVVVAPWRTPPDLTLGLFEQMPPHWIGPWLAVGALGSVAGTAFVLAATTRVYLHGFGEEVTS